MNHKKLKIMIIEDEMCIRESLQWFLEDSGYEVIARDSPFDCMVYTGGQSTTNVSCSDVLIIDQHLPDMKGLDFVEQLVERGFKGIMQNILLMSGDATSIDATKAERLGIKVVQKPVAFEYLENWLTSLEQVAL